MRRLEVPPTVCKDSRQVTTVNHIRKSTLAEVNEMVPNIRARAFGVATVTLLRQSAGGRKNDGCSAKAANEEEAVKAKVEFSMKEVRNAGKVEVTRRCAWRR